MSDRGQLQLNMDHDDGNMLHPDMVPQSHQTSSWLAQLMSQQNRRGSLGFSDSFNGSLPPSALCDDSNSPMPSRKSSLVFFKTDRLGGPSEGSPRPSCGPSLELASLGQQLQLEEKAHVAFRDPPKVSLEMAGATGHPSAVSGITDKVASTFRGQEFPIATVESLVELSDMKRRIRANSEGETQVFAMDLDKPEQSESTMSQEAIEPRSKSFSGNNNRPSGLATYLLQTGMAQNWFFRNPDHGDHSSDEDISGLKQKPNTTVLGFADNSVPGVIIKTAPDLVDAKAKLENRVGNAFSPQNF